MRLSDLKKSVAQLVAAGGGAITKHFIGGSGEPTFGSSWTGTSATDAEPGFYKDGRQVHLFGRVQKSILIASPEVPFTLPVGFRPDGPRWFSALVWDVTTSAVIPDGQMIMGTIDGADDLQVSLDGINFLAA